MIIQRGAHGAIKVQWECQRKNIVVLLKTLRCRDSQSSLE